NDTAPTEIYTLSLHDALPISGRIERVVVLSDGWRYRIVANRCNGQRVRAIRCGYCFVRLRTSSRQRYTTQTLARICHHLAANRICPEASEIHIALIIIDVYLSCRRGENVVGSDRSQREIFSGRQVAKKIVAVSARCVGLLGWTIGEVYDHSAHSMSVRICNRSRKRVAAP